MKGGWAVTQIPRLCCLCLEPPPRPLPRSAPSPSSGLRSNVPSSFPESHVHRSTASAWLNVFPVRFISDIVSSAALISCSLSVSCHKCKVWGAGLGSRLHPQTWSCARWRMCATRPVGGTLCAGRWRALEGIAKMAQSTAQLTGSGGGAPEAVPPTTWL